MSQLTLFLAQTMLDSALLLNDLLLDRLTDETKKIANVALSR